MLKECLARMPVALFVREYLRKRPYASPSSACSIIPFFESSTLERLITEDRTADVLLVARGKLVEVPIPRTSAETHALMREGVSLVIRRAEEHDTALARLAASLTQSIPGEVHVQLFVTPAGTYGFGWHYDDEDVFVVQTSGTKDYFFRQNTVERNRPAGAVHDFARFSDESSPIGTARLLAGDWLYLPSRWWHVAKCVEDSLSISLGLSPNTAWLATIDASREPVEESQKKSGYS